MYQYLSLPYISFCKFLLQKTSEMDGDTCCPYMPAHKELQSSKKEERVTSERQVRFHGNFLEADYTLNHSKPIYFPHGGFAFSPQVNICRKKKITSTLWWLSWKILHDFHSQSIIQPVEQYNHDMSPFFCWFWGGFQIIWLAISISHCQWKSVL